MLATLAIPILLITFAEPPAEKLDRQKQETARMKERIAAMLPDLEGAAAAEEDPSKLRDGSDRAIECAFLY